MSDWADFPVLNTNESQDGDNNKEKEGRSDQGEETESEVAKLRRELEYCKRASERRERFHEDSTRSLRGSLDHADRSHRRVTQELDDVLRDRAELRTIRGRLSGRVDDMTRDIDDQRKKIANLEHNLRESELTSNKYKKEFSETVKRTEKLAVDLKTAEKGRDESDRRFNKISRDFEALSASNASLTEQWETAKQEIETLKAKAAELERAAKEPKEALMNVYTSMRGYYERMGRELLFPSVPLAGTPTLSMHLLCLLWTLLYQIEKEKQIEGGASLTLEAGEAREKILGTPVATNNQYIVKIEGLDASLSPQELFQVLPLFDVDFTRSVGTARVIGFKSPEAALMSSHYIAQFNPRAQISFVQPPKSTATTPAPILSFGANPILLQSLLSQMPAGQAALMTQLLAQQSQSQSASNPSAPDSLFSNPLLVSTPANTAGATSTIAPQHLSQGLQINMLQQLLNQSQKQSVGNANSQSQATIYPPNQNVSATASNSTPSASLSQIQSNPGLLSAISKFASQSSPNPSSQGTASNSNNILLKPAVQSFFANQQSQSTLQGSGPQSSSSSSFTSITSPLSNSTGVKRDRPSEGVPSSELSPNKKPKLETPAVHTQTQVQAIASLQKTLSAAPQTTGKPESPQSKGSWKAVDQRSYLIVNCLHFSRESLWNLLKKYKDQIMDFSQASASEEVRVKLKGHKSSVLMENFLLTSTPLSKKDIKVEISEKDFLGECNKLIVANAADSSSLTAIEKLLASSGIRARVEYASRPRSTRAQGNSVEITVVDVKQIESAYKLLFNSPLNNEDLFVLYQPPH